MMTVLISPPEPELVDRGVLAVSDVAMYLANKRRVLKVDRRSFQDVRTSGARPGLRLLGRGHDRLGSLAPAGLTDGCEQRLDLCFFQQVDLARTQVVYHVPPWHLRRCSQGWTPA